MMKFASNVAVKIIESCQLSITLSQFAKNI